MGGCVGRAGVGTGGCARNLYFEKEYDELGYELKSLILCEILNGYEIKSNLLGLEFVDELMSCIEE